MKRDAAANSHRSAWLRLVPLYASAVYHRWARSGRIDLLRRIDDPNGARLASVFDRVHSRDYGESGPWFERIEAERARMLRCKDLIEHRKESPSTGETNRLTVRRACHGSKGHLEAVLLHFLVREFQPQTAVELGMNVGISSSYQAAAMTLNGGGTFVTLEGSAGRAAVAQGVHENLGLDKIECVLGYFAQTLAGVVSDLKVIDYAFIDGHHKLQPTLDYFDCLWPNLSEGAIVVFDDIGWSSEMKQAWRILQQDNRIKIAVDMLRMGVCVVTKEPSESGRYVTPIITI